MAIVTSAKVIRALTIASPTMAVNQTRCEGDCHVEDTKTHAIAIRSVRQAEWRPRTGDPKPDAGDFFSDELLQSMVRVPGATAYAYTLKTRAEEIADFVDHEKAKLLMKLHDRREKAARTFKT